MATSSFSDTFWPGFLSNLIAGVLILLASVAISVSISRGDSKAARLRQQKDEERARIMVLIQHLGFLDKEVEVFETKLPELLAEVERYEWGRLVFFHPTAWEIVRNNSQFLSQLSQDTANHLIDFYHDLADASNCIDRLISAWWADPSVVPSFEQKQKALHKEAVASLENASLKSSKLRWVILAENKRLNEELQTVNSRKQPLG